MEEVSDVLLKEILDITDEEVLDIMDASRKSELALRGNESSYRPVDAAVVAKDIEKITKKVVAIKITTENEDLDC